MYVRKFVVGIVATASLTTFSAFSLPTTGWAQIEEMLVTARRREERLQDIPIAVTAFSVQDIARKSIDSIRDVGLLSSSLQYDEAVAPDATKLVVRGLSNTRGRSNAAILVDGIDTTTESIAQNGQGATFNLRMADLQRIEVVKGPQSALFGRSAFNGAIQFVTKDPSDEFEADLEIEGGQFNRYNAETTISGPITNNLGFRLSGTWWDEEGFFRNARNNQKVGGSDGWSVAGTLKWEPTSNLWFKLRAEYTDQAAEQNAAVQVKANIITATPPLACALQPTVPDPTPVFDCDSVDVGISVAAVEAFEGFMNPNGVAPVPGPIVIGSNECNGPYMNSIASQGFTCQFFGAVPDASGLGDVYFNVDPRTGKNFRGLEAGSLRISLLGEWDVGFGVIKSWTGYYDGRTHSIQDWQAGGNPTNCGTYRDPVTGAALLGDDYPSFEDQGCVLSYNDNEHFIDQWSQELQFQSDWDHWQQLTVGGLRWVEDRDFFDKGGTQRARAVECYINAALDATLGPCGLQSVPITGEIFQQVLDARVLAHDGLINGMGGDRETWHWSAYFQAETDLSRLTDDVFGNTSLPGQWSLITEARWNHETTNMSGLDSSDSGSTGASICGGGPIFGSTGGAPSYTNACSGFVVPDFGFGASGGLPLLPVTTANFSIPLCNFTEAELVDILAGRGGETEIFLLGINCNGDPTTAKKRASTTSNWITGKVTLQWEPTDDMLWYFSHSWAAKPAGFSTLALGSSGFAPESDIFVAEKMRVYELGVKSAWFGNTLQVNGSGFFQDFSDKQTNSQTAVINPTNPEDIGTSPRVVNASAARVWGGELDVLWAPDVDVLGGEVQFGGSYTYLDAHYVDFKTINFSGSDIAETLSCEPIIDEETGFAACIIDRSGNPMEDAPKHAANISASWIRPLFDDWNIFVEQDTQYTGKRWIEDTNSNYVDKWWNTDLRIGIENEQFEFLFFVNNLFDDDSTQRANTTPGLSCCFNFAHLRIEDVGKFDTARGGPVFNSGVVIGTLRPPRHMGVRASAHF